MHRVDRDADQHPDHPLALCDLAAQLAHQAGSAALAGRRARGSAGVDRSTKSSPVDLVTEFDRAAERLIVDALRHRRPGDAIIGEEGAAFDGSTGFAWFVDPIDGTTNFVYDQPAWACSIGVAERGEMVAGAVYVAPLDELYTAARGHGAWCNGEPISVSATADLAVALIGTGFSYQADTRRQQGEVIARLLGRVRDIRRLGSAAVDLCFVAAGRLDAYFERHLNAWDCAAGELIAREAGAVVSDHAGGPPTPAALLAATPAIHAALLAALR